MLSPNKKIQPYPLSIRIYKGEGRLLFIPVIKHIYGYSVTAPDSFCLNDSEKETVIGKTVIDALEYVANSPRSSATPKEIDNYFLGNSRYKSFLSFWKNNHFAHVDYYEDGKVKICSLSRAKRQGMYEDVIKRIELKNVQNTEIIGCAVLDVLKASEDYYMNSKKTNKPKRMEIELLDGSKLTYIVPSEKIWEDSEDCGAAEIYQSYSYIKKSDEDIAVMMFSIADELNCDITEQNIFNEWTDHYGKTVFFDYKKSDKELFDVRSEFRNKKIHKISYYKQQSDDLILECSIEVYNPNKRKKTEEKLLSEFEDFINSIVYQADCSA